MRIPIPHSSAQAWNDFRKTTYPKNLGLIFDRFVEQDWGANPDKEAKKKALQNVLSFKEGDRPEIPHRPDEKLLKAWIARWTAVAKRANAGEPLRMKTDWRFVTGLGRKGPLETGFTFHRYGFPILPGSSVKGVARAYAFFWLDDQVAKNENLEEGNLPTLIEILEEESDETFEKKFREACPNTNPEVARNLRAVFGTKADSGGAIFFDAIPAEVPELKLDIVNPHYPDYYKDTSGKTPPTDWQSPIPSYFLTVAPGQVFLFAVGWRGRPNSELQKIACDWLESGLKKLGAGGKTSAGYGYFKEVQADSSQDAALSVAAHVNATAEPPKGAEWKKGKISNDGKAIHPADAPDQTLRFHREHVLPKDFTPGRKSEVEYVEETLPDGSERIWVKKMYFPTE